MEKGKPKGRETKADLAIHIAISTMFAWANLVDALTRAFDRADMSRDIILEFLDAIEDANDDVMPEDSAIAFRQFLASIRKEVACND
jgi:hypothetical protein